MIKHKCIQNPSSWHRWYAWHPIRVYDRHDTGGKICWYSVWLEYVERRSVGSWGDSWWEYRLK